MKKLLVLSLLLLLILPGLVSGQYILKEADAAFELYDYSKAVNLYSQAYQKKKSLHAIERIAESYRKMKNYKQAEVWYAKLTKTTGADDIAILLYAEALQNNSKYDEAKVQYLLFGTTNKSVNKNKLTNWLNSCDSAAKWIANPKPVNVKNLKFLNSPKSDWGAVRVLDEIVFTSDRKSTESLHQNKINRPFFKFDGNKIPDKSKYGWTGNNYLRLYHSDESLDSDSSLSKPIVLFPINTKSDYHVGAASFTEDGKETFFTVTRISKEKAGYKSKPLTVFIEIYSSIKASDGSWTEPLPFRYNSALYSVGDPFITPDGQKLYFVSDKPGGKGGTDIYMSRRNGDGTWADAINLEMVNTHGNERSPSLANNRRFYFSSDGRVGMGGLDIYQMDYPDENGSTIKNMEYPINSSQDDFSFISNSVSGGYFASNREGGLGEDDIYSYLKKIIPNLILKGVVYNKNTGLPLNNATVSLTHKDVKTTIQTDYLGRYEQILEAGYEYEVKGEKKGYLYTTALSVSTIDKNESVVFKRDMFLDSLIINKSFKLENIYYDFDKSEIRQDAAVELNKLVSVLMEYPEMKIELSSHTDSRGNDKYNMDLSQRRSDSAVKYIISKGINANRLIAKGYGETRPVNSCSNGVICTEVEYQLNRRTEYKIIKK
ncbi:OmpA family protein [Pedobacter cryoconitis]|uniref:WD40 repeat protein n=1 Tax=Pedobacter cryoconitis TaxID=188932 RepID=A0A327S4E0_9SPHI|nr:OmpA family protein [Pedobacter cryoconitis]RAJ20577.1 WD40 repeat protein [Pedobacter cryoconitis]